MDSPGRPGRPAGPDAEEGRVNVNDIDTVCCECYKVTKNRYSITCPMCGGTVVHTRAGMGKQTSKDLKERGSSHFVI
jgi:hypothetical protein